MTEPYDSCPVCKTRHPKGWACPAELRAIAKRLDEKLDEIIDLRRQLAEANSKIARLEEDNANLEGVVEWERDGYVTLDGYEHRVPTEVAKALADLHRENERLRKTIEDTIFELTYWQPDRPAALDQLRTALAQDKP